MFGGGIVPEDDIPPFKELGVAEIFGPGTPPPPWSTGSGSASAEWAETPSE